MRREPDDSMSFDVFKDFLKAAAVPVDFRDLVARRILKRVRGREYLLLKPALLPPHASRQIVSLEQTTAGLRVSFQDSSKVAARLLKQYERASASADVRAGRADGPGGGG